VNENDTPHPIWVNTPQAFESMRAALANAAVVGVDTESNSLHAYREQVCLIQFSTREQDYLVDPLAGLNLTPLGKLFSSSRVVKVFHASEYDIICLRRDFNFEFQNIFDTMQAARILGREKLSLGDVLEREFGIHLDKHLQKANWAIRPLPLPLQVYACLDTHFLIPLYWRLEQELRGNGMEVLAQEDFKRLSFSRAGINHIPPYSQVRGYQDLNRRQLAVLNQLCLYRDEIARRNNIPLFKVLSNEALLEIACQCPRNEQDLKKIAALPLGLFERHSKGLLKAVREGMRAEPITRQTHQKPDEEYLARLERLKSWRKKKAGELKVLADVILPKDILEDLTVKNPRDMDSLQVVMASVPWRVERFGREILTTLQQEDK